MNRISPRFRRLAALSMALALSTLTLGSAGARADIAYAYAEQTISDVHVTVANGSLTLTSGPSSSATTSAHYDSLPNGISNGPALDPAQAFQGLAPPAPENDFNKYATFGASSPLPAGAVPLASSPSNFARSDALISGPSNNTGQLVAEAYLNTTGTTSAFGNPAYTGSVSFTPTANTTLSLSYNYVNDLFVAFTGSGLAQASFKFNVTLQDSNGNVIFSMSPSPQNNFSVSAPPNSPEVVGSGSINFTSTTLTQGANYTLTFTGQNLAVVSITAVPEPGPVALGSVVGVVVVLAAALRRRSGRQPRA